MSKECVYVSSKNAQWKKGSSGKKNYMLKEEEKGNDWQTTMYGEISKSDSISNNTESLCCTVSHHKKNKLASDGN